MSSSSHQQQCVLATMFSCSCPLCLGESDDYTKNILPSSSSSSSSYHQNCNDDENNSSSSMPTTISTSSTLSSNSLITTFVTTDEYETFSSLINAKFLDDENNGSSVEETPSSNHSVIKSEEQVDPKSPSSSLEQTQTKPKNKNKKLLRQEQKRKSRSYLAVVQALRQFKQSKPFNNNPSFIITPTSSIKNNHQKATSHHQKKSSCPFPWFPSDSTSANYQYLPSWCLEWNLRSLRALREISICKLRVEDNSIAPGFHYVEYFPVDRKVIDATWRLPRSTAIANRRRNDWIVNHKIFNCQTPFLQHHLVDDDENHTNNNNNKNNCSFEYLAGGESKEDSRGALQYVRRCKFQGMDDKFRCNRNNGFKRNNRRNNGCDQGKQVYMGNSVKLIHGKPWLHKRNTRPFKQKFQFRLD